MATKINPSNSLMDLAHRIKVEHEEAAGALRREHAISAGELLLQAKAQLKYGHWLSWLKEHCAIPERTARHYMRLASAPRQIKNGPV